MPITLDGSVGITFPDSSIQTTAGGGSFRNRIINGAMVIDQRNAGASLSVTGTVYTVDRWKAQTTAGSTFQQITSTISGFAKSLKYTSSASNSFMQMGQQIEFLNCADLQNQAVIISFRAKANNTNAGSTALTVRTRTGATVDGSVIFSATNSDTAVTLTTSDTLYTVSRALPSTFGALSVEFVLGSHVSGDGFEITGVQLEKGSAATPFDYRPYGTELALCQRYYFKKTVAVEGGGISAATTAFDTISGIEQFFPVEMRTTPTLTLLGTTARSGGTANDQRISTTHFVWGNKQTGSGTAQVYAYATGGFTVESEL